MQRLDKLRETKLLSILVKLFYPSLVLEVKGKPQVSNVQQTDSMNCSVTLASMWMQAVPESSVNLTLIEPDLIEDFQQQKGSY